MNSIRVALEEMRNHPLRTSLTAAGVAIAISTVVTVGALLTGAFRLMREAVYDSSGASRATVLFGNPSPHSRVRPSSRSNPLGAADATAITRAWPKDVAHATAQSSVSATISRESFSETAQIDAVQPAFFHIYKRELVAGRTFLGGEVADAAAVAVISAYTASRVFDDIAPVGRELRLNGVRFVVIGVVADRDYAGRRLELITPISTCRARLVGCGGADTMIVMRVAAAASMHDLKRAVPLLLQQRHPEYRASDFELLTSENSLRQQNNVLLLLTAIFAVICSVCLLMGGIGIMNVLLSSVAERAREIGVRRAVGATRRDIFRQFVVESLCISGAGCLVGLVVGYTFAFLVSVLINVAATRGGYGVQFHATLSPFVVILAIASSTLTGLTFGAYPAQLAARRDPAEALRTE